MPDEAEKLGFLSRWSRRKRGEELPEPPPPEEAPLADVPEVEAAPEPVAAAPEPEFDLASLPPIETLDASSDFTAFLKPGVPHALRSAALRKAWLADPLIRDYMSPLDYAWDFNTPGGLPHGFSNVLAETGEALRKLVNQAIGEMEPEEEKPPEEVLEGVVLAEGEALDPPLPESEPTAALAEAPQPRLAPIHDGEDMPPLGAIRLSEAPVPAESPGLEQPPLPPRRRHGGALPA